MKLEWDPAKAQANLQEHQVSFSEASTVLEDEFSLTREDPDPEGEQRFVTLGMSSFGNLLVVVYTYRETGQHSPDFGLESQFTPKERICQGSPLRSTVISISLLLNEVR